MPLSTGERLPGIVVTIENQGIIAPAGFERFPAIIGRGDYEVIKERNLGLTRSSTTSYDDLRAEPSTSPVVTVWGVGRAPGATQFSEGTDYTITPSPSSTVPARVEWAPGGAEPPVGTKYFLNYTVEIPASAFEPLLYLDEQLMIRERGSELFFSSVLADDREVNPLVAAGRLAFKNNAPGVVILQLDFHPSVTGNGSLPGVTALDWGDPLNPTTVPPIGGTLEMEPSYDIAVQKINKVEEFKLWLVPMDPGSDPDRADWTFGEDNNSRFFIHALSASAPDEGRERTLLGSYPRGTDLTLMTAIAESFKEQANPFDENQTAGNRIALPGVKGPPGDLDGHTVRSAVAIQVGTISGSTASATTLGSNQNVNFLMAATGGLLAGSFIGAPNNFAPISGVTLYDSWILDEARELRRNGVIPFKRRRADIANLGTIMAIPITVDTTNVFTEDLSVQDTADYLRQFVRLRLFDLYRNTKITADTEGAIETSVTSILQTLVQDRILAEFRDVQAQQDTIEPRRIFVRARVKPAFPLRFLDVNFAFVASFE